MRSPRRLVDDPSAPADLREALQSEADLVDDYDLEALRARVLQAQNALPPGDPRSAGPRIPRSPRWWVVVGVSGMTAAIVTLGLQSFQLSPATVSRPRATPIDVVDTHGAQAPNRMEALPATELDTPDTTPASPPAAAPAAVAPQVDVDVPSTVMMTDPIADLPVADTPVAEPPDAASPPVATADLPAAAPDNSLAKELAAYNGALDAASRRDWSIARDAYTAYLAKWPQGHLVTEAKLGLLAATVESSSPAAAEALAAEILRTTSLGNRRTDVELVRAEALVQLDRCDEAMGIIEEMRRDPRVSSIRQSCRRARHLE